MKPGPALRAKRQQTRDARRRTGKSMNATIQDRASWSSLSGRALAGQARTRRVPAYEIRKLAVRPPELVEAWRAYSGKTSQRANRAGLGNGVR